MQVESPLAKLTPQQLATIEELKKIAAEWIPNLEQPEIDFLHDELCCYRYVIGVAHHAFTFFTTLVQIQNWQFYWGKFFVFEFQNLITFFVLKGIYMATVGTLMMPKLRWKRPWIGAQLLSHKILHYRTLNPLQSRAIFTSMDLTYTVDHCAMLNLVLTSRKITKPIDC